MKQHEYDHCMSVAVQAARHTFKLGICFGVLIGAIITIVVWLLVWINEQ